MKTVSIYIILLISNTCVCLDWKKVVILAFFEFEAKIMREFTHSLIPVYCIKFFEFILDLSIQNFLGHTFNIIQLLFYVTYFIYVY